MKIIYCGAQYEYLNLKRGLSFEHNNFYLSLKNYFNDQVIYHPLDKILEIGKRSYNRQLKDLVIREKPDLVFCFMYSNELDKKTLIEIQKYTKTLAWFADDNWRFGGYTRYWAPYFSWNVTTYKNVLPKYEKIGARAILSQWACNTSVFKPTTNYQLQTTDYSVAFVGQKNPARLKIISYLKKQGINVECFGAGWPNGRVPLSEMVEIFSNSKINLNLNPPSAGFDLPSFLRLFFKRRFNYIVLCNPIISFKEWFFKREPQIKARTFEIPGCGGFMITGYGPDIGDYYKIGKEIEAYKNINDLAEKIKYYLEHDEERRAIAKSGYDRTVRDHTYEKRFEEIFKTVFK